MQSSGRLSYRVGAFLVLQLAAAATGYLLGGHLGKAPAAQLLRLGLFGYGAAGLGAALLAVSCGDHLRGAVAFLSVALSASLAYGYAAFLAATAAVVVLGAVPGLRRWQTRSSPDVQVLGSE
jgi:hypothetical protein